MDAQQAATAAADEPSIDDSVVRENVSIRRQEITVNRLTSGH